MAIYWTEKSSPEIGELSKRYLIVILHIGSTEQHGPDLPTATDYIIAWELSKKVADTLKAIIKDVALSLNRYGFKHLVIISGYVDHLGQISDITCQLNLLIPQTGLRIHNVSPYTAVSTNQLSIVLEEEMFIHAEEVETSLMLYLRPEFVDMKKGMKEHPDLILKGLTKLNFLEAIRIVTISKFLWRDFTIGICHDATLASKEKGEKLFKIHVSGLIDYLKRVTKE